MQVGDLVEYTADGDIGLIVEEYQGQYHVLFPSGDTCWCIFSELLLIA